MTITYKTIKDEMDRDALEVTDTQVKKQIIDKDSIIAEISRLQALLDKFNV